MKYPLIGASLLVLAATGAAAQTAPAASAPQVRDIVVTGVLERSEADVLSGTSIVTGDELTRDLRPTIGETLARQPGVSATSFGPGASRPVLRGLQGDRIRVLTDGIGSIDVSNTSVDHAVVIDPLLAERVEVLRGPVALLFGSSAVGGVVNVIDTRIPRRLPTEGYRLQATGTYGSAADERSGGAAADVAIGGRFVLHADGSYLKADDLRTGGFILSRAARAQALASGDDAIAESAGLKGRLPNSAIETWTAGVGASLVTDTGHLGVSYAHYDSFYGIPIRYPLATGEEAEAPRLDVVQDRLDLRGEVETGGGFLDRIRVRAAHADYRHFELEDTGEIATRFYNQGIEGRLELVQAKRDGWLGASGIQYLNRDFDVIGEEAFLPKNRTEQVGLFTLQQFDLGPLKVEGGVRWEQTDLVATPLASDAAFFAGKRDFSTVSGSLGASYEIADDVRFGVNLSRTARAPSAEELFANGPHAGTQAYELGNPDFKVEKSWGLEATLHAHGDGFSLDASAYHSWFSDYIFQDQVARSVCEDAAAPSGREVDLPCFQALQADARYWGFEVDASARLAQLGETAVNVDLVGDYVRASLDSGGTLPRIPPLRVLGGIEAQGARFAGRIEAEHVFEQDRVTAFETPTGDYTLVNASVSWKPFADQRATLLVSGNNLFDVEARRHASVLKDFAPLAGRDIRATLRLAL